MKMTRRVLSLIMVMAMLFSSFAFATELPEEQVVIIDALAHEHDETCDHEEAAEEEYVLAARADEEIVEEIGEIDLLDPTVYGDEILPELDEKGGDFSNEWAIECTDCGDAVVVDYFNDYDDGHTAVCVHGVEGCMMPHYNDDGIMINGGDSHYGRCDVCDRSILWGNHYAPCNAEDTGVCAECGFAAQRIEIRHEQASMDYTYDSDGHWIPCANCDEKLDFGEHGNYCDAVPESGVGTCYICNQENVNLINVWHEWQDVYVPVDGGHRSVCETCSQPYGDVEEHWADCVDKSVCTYCGYDADADLENWSHSALDLSAYRYDSEYHYYWCDGCKEIYGNKIAHEANCQSKTECEYCDYVSTTGDIPKISHDSWDSSVYVSAGAEGHGYKCYDCGGAAGYGLDEHRGLCTDPTICRDCNYVSETPLTPAHLYENIDWEKYVPTEDGSGHGWLCTECNGAAVFGDEPEEHWRASCLDPYTCIDCGYTGTEKLEYDHEPDYDTGYQPVEGGHTILCTVCNEPVYDVEKHYGSCDDPYTCMICGFVSDTAMKWEHDWDYGNCQSDDKGHWYLCLQCGEAGAVDPHWADCSNDPNVCDYCGHEGGEIRIDHNFWGSEAIFQESGYGHVRVCTTEGCGALDDDIEDHFTNCDGEAGKCSGCNADVEYADIEHDYDYDTYYSDTYEHWVTCALCGAESDHWDHWAPCDSEDKTECYECGAKDVVTEADHDYDWENMQWDEIGHWLICEGCGETSSKEHHVASCTDPNACIECAYTNEDGIDRVSHEQGERKYDENYHWDVCDDCGQVVYKEEHYASCRNPKVCRYCGYEGDKELWYGHDMGNTVVDADEYGHTYKCKYCDYTERSLHEVKCTSDSSICRTCGYDCEYAYNNHRYSEYIPTADGTACYQLCLDCNKLLDYEKHFEICSNPGVCESCGIKFTGESEYTYHDYGEVYKSDATYHYRKCINCGTENKSKHYDLCSDDDDNCENCGKATTNLSHQHTYYKITAKTHASVCYDCGYEFKANEHYGYCYNSEVCTACGAPNPSKIYHVGGDSEEDCQSCNYIPPVEGATVTLNKSELTLGVKEKFTLIAEASHDATVTYKSNKTSVAKVDAKTGKITAVKTGTAVITAKTSTGVFAACTVTVKKAPTSVKASVSKVTLGVGETFTITGKISSSAASAFTFSSAKKSVATIDENGVITAEKTGTAKIYVKTFNGKKGLCTVTVKPAPEVVTVTASKTEMSVGQTAKLTTKLTTAAGKTAAGSYTYTAEPANCVTIENGVLTANETGTVTVTATTYNQERGSVTISILPAPDKAKVNVEGLALTLGVKETFTIKAEAENGSPADFTYTTDKKSVATVSTSGKITAKKNGSAVITVKPHLGEPVEIAVTVVSAPKSVKLSSKKLTLGVGEDTTLKATLSSSKSASALKWKSSKSSVVEVDQEGNLTPKKAGKATITVTTFNKKKATCTVTVKPAPVSLTLSPATLEMGIDQTYTLKPVITKGSASKLTYTLEGNAVTVSSSGKIVAVEEGNATITVSTFNGHSAKIDITVKKKPTSLVLPTYSTSLGTDLTLDLGAILNDGAGGLVTYSSSNSKVASVSSTGIVTAKKAGVTKITVKTYNGLKATCTVKVFKSIAAVLSAPLDTLGEVAQVVTSRKDLGTFYSVGNFRFVFNTADGIILSWGAKNLSEKTIKYITFTVKYYNSVGDVAYDSITKKSTKTIKLVGPIAPGQGFMFRDIIGYSKGVDYGVITDVKVDFMDGTSKSGTYGYTTWHNSHIQASPDRLYVIN